MAVVSVQFTLIDICTETNEQSLISDREKHMLCMYVHHSICLSMSVTRHKHFSLTCAVDSISPKASITGTLKATKCVIACSINMAVIHPSHTLLNISQKYRVMYIMLQL